jgi:hypothetical protein
VASGDLGPFSLRASVAKVRLRPLRQSKIVRRFPPAVLGMNPNVATTSRSARNRTVASKVSSAILRSSSFLFSSSRRRM